MERQERSGVIYLFLVLLTIVFLAFACYLVRSVPTEADYTIRTEHKVEEPTAPERVFVELNSASAEELDTLTGIGPALAEEIIDYRTEHGPFTALEDLLEVKGIGEAKLEGFRHEITIGGKTP